MSPYEIELLLWYHCRPMDHEDMGRNPPVWQPTIQRFKQLELLEDDPRGNQAYRLTERGHFYVTDGLCKVELPVHEWRIPAPESQPCPQGEKS